MTDPTSISRPHLPVAAVARQARIQRDMPPDLFGEVPAAGPQTGFGDAINAGLAAASGSGHGDDDAASAASGARGDAVESVRAAAESSGEPLPAAQRAKFERALGVDLGGVTIHVGGASNRAAEAVNAHAYALGDQIHFAAGEYDPASPAGEHLLAHEVAHTVQQAGASTPSPQFRLEISQPGDALEDAADRAAVAMVNGHAADGTTVPLSRAARGMLSRSVRTAGGRFEAPEYAAKVLPAYGAHLTLSFTPNSTVVAEHIALVQTVRSMVNRPGEAPHPLIRSSVQGGATDPLLTVQDPHSPGFGTRVDSPDGRNSPVYGSEAGSTGLADLHGEPMEQIVHDRVQHGPVGPLREGHAPELDGGVAQQGFRRVHDGHAQVQQAVMLDAPGQYVHPGEQYSGQIIDAHFEVGALAIDGQQPNRWLGTVGWGYHVDATGHSTLTPRHIHKTSNGDPGPAFSAAARQWNDATLPDGTPTIDVPLPSTPASATPHGDGRDPQR